MPTKVVTFDCAQTLVDVRFSVPALTRDCARDVGLEVEDAAIERFVGAYVATIDDYWTINARRDADACEQYWRDLTRAWLVGEGLSPALAAPMREACLRRLFGPDSAIFRLFEDVIPCLDRLTEAGIRLGVISNWDYTLFRTLESLGIKDRFEVVVASRWEGVEKPDPRLFEIAFASLGVSAEEVLHVGDDPIDDVQGARAAGAHAVLLDRMRVTSDASIGSLADLTTGTAESLGRGFPPSGR